MARDYKHRRRPRKKGSKSKTTGPFVGGLSVGLAIALLVHLYHQGQQSARRPERPRPTMESVVTAPEVAEEEDPPFDFYDILPEYEVIIPEEIKPGPSQGNAKPASPAPAFFIQAGSFRRYEDADRRKASLALLGISSSIRKVQVNSGATHRVQIGPISDSARLRSLQKVLSENSIEYLTLRAKDPVT